MVSSIYKMAMKFRYPAILENSLPYFVELRQNRIMSLFEEYLTLGPWLAESESRALYGYLVKTRSKKYRLDSRYLLRNKVLNSISANGEILYSTNARVVEYKVRKIGRREWSDPLRVMKLPAFDYWAKRKLHRFFAQAELDTLQNFPLHEPPSLEERGLSINVFPYYALDYYSNGRGKLRGLIGKLTLKDDPLLERLFAS